MAGLATLTKMALGGKVSFDEVAESLSNFGIEIETAPAVPSDFETLSEESQQPGAKLNVLRGKLKGGERIMAVIAVIPHGNASLPR